MLSATTPGQFTVCLTDGPVQETAFELSADLTANGDRLIVLDAAECFEPARMSQAAPDLAKHLHILRVSVPSESERIWSELLMVRHRYDSPRVLAVGILDHLYDPQIPTRDASRALGRMKAKLEDLTENGIEVIVVCRRPDNSDVRAHFVRSLCASAHQIISQQARRPLAS